MNSIFSVRLKQARIMRGLSMDALCDKVGNAITKQSISKYETGKMLPDSKILILLSKALEVSIDYFFRQPSGSVENVEFRKKSKLGVKQIDSIKEVVKDQLERYFEIENLNAIESSYRVQSGNVLVQDEDDIYPIVKRVKAAWQLGEDGINNLIEGLMATSTGYYVTHDTSELRTYIVSLKGREEAIREMRESMELQLERMVEKCPPVS